jgi:RimJ/RimL family protein N-acetyltransferase
METFMLETKNLILRDLAESDIEKRIYWETIETDWQLWDAPWEYEGLTEEEKAHNLSEYIDNLRVRAKRFENMPKDKKRYSFEIETKDSEKTYIGWVSSYNIDVDCTSTKNPGHCTVGIDIPDISARGKGYSYQALCAFIHYLLEHGESEIYTQTWSGNERMIHIALKIGFEEYHKKIGIRSVRGGTYDGLTFKLNQERFKKFSSVLLD